MAQSLLLGLGGTGSRIVDFVAEELKANNIGINDGNICCAVLDTDQEDRKRLEKYGSGIPVIGTSKDRIIDTYMRMYNEQGVWEWMPTSNGLLEESMTKGASQMRAKSRLAFMDTVKDRSIEQLERHIEKLFDRRDEEDIAVMVVASLAGGTGSGMFIQTALWLRQYFAKKGCRVRIRGLFILPDVFIRTVKKIKDSKTETQKLYANAYGAIRELIALDKIKLKGFAPLMPVKIDDLFDSEKNVGKGIPVYDKVFFVDDVAQDGSGLEQLEYYQKLVAHMVYTQLYSPMSAGMLSSEDNLFVSHDLCKEPVFGSCGTAKAVYPAEDILRYCALRATQDAVSTGWRKIDDEIADIVRREEEDRARNVRLTSRIDPRQTYVKRFAAKIALKGDQIGTDTLFVDIAYDISDETKTKDGNGKVQTIYTDKVSNYIKRLTSQVEQTVDTENQEMLQALRLGSQWKEKEDTVDHLKTLVKKHTQTVDAFLAQVDTDVEKTAETLVDTLCPADMGDVNAFNQNSILGLFTKQDKDEKTYFVHPLAVRYMLYRLIDELDEIKQSAVLKDLREAAVTATAPGEKPIDWDYSGTLSNTEKTPLEYLEKKLFVHPDFAFIKSFKKKYFEYNQRQAEQCRVYAIELLKLKVVQKLAARLEMLISGVEGFFRALPKVTDTLGQKIVENVQKNEKCDQKMIYICASGEEKESLYKSLRFDAGKTDHQISEIILYALYGQFCAQEKPNAQNNKDYKGQSVEVTFYNEAIKTYSKRIAAKNQGDINLDIYDAVSKSADIAYEKEQAKEDTFKQEERYLNTDQESNGNAEDAARKDRHDKEMQKLFKELERMSAPFLRTGEDLAPDKVVDPNWSEVEATRREEYQAVKSTDTLWGFHPVLAEKFPEMGQALGLDVQRGKNYNQPRNELECHRAVYGVQARLVEKFNELNGGVYFANYDKIIRTMVKDMAAGVAGAPAALIGTPHLDKTWHLFLPYVTPQKQELEDRKFYRYFLLAMAYGMVSLDDKGYYQIRRNRVNAMGAYKSMDTLMYKGKPVGKVDIVTLLNALRMDGAFMIDAVEYEELFLKECQELVTYEATEFLRGAASKKDNNAVTVIVRYHNSAKKDEMVTVMLLQSLEQLCCKMAGGMYKTEDMAKVKAAGMELCRRIYNASALKNKLIGGLMDNWKVSDPKQD